MTKFIIKLKQHTPLIHFQSEQPGAILRATEVKPKLDKFLQKHAFNDFEEYKHYLIGYQEGKTKSDFEDKESFDYKLRIYTDISKIDKVDIEGSMKSLCFASGLDGKKLRGVFTNEDIILEFFTFHEKLKKIIENKAEEFFCIYNFGARQNKGFGSFYLNKTKNKNIVNKYLKYKLELRKKINSWEDVFKEIDKISNNIRSKEIENKPYIKEFAKKNNIIWDKEVIRDKFINDRSRSIENAYIIKDLLGLSSSEVWKHKNKENFEVRKEHVCNDNKNKIERMQSPIFFKPLKDENGNFEIYIKFNHIPEEFWNQNFRIIKCNQKDTKSFQLSTPEKTKFDIEKFFEFVRDKENIKSASNTNRNSFSPRIRDSMDSKTLDKLKKIK